MLWTLLSSNVVNFDDSNGVRPILILDIGYRHTGC